LRNNSTACRKLTPSSFITQSIGPPAAPQPKQWNRFLPGLTTSEGVASSWNGHRATQSLPCLASAMPRDSTSRTSDTSAFKRSSSD